MPQDECIVIEKGLLSDPLGFLAKNVIAVSDLLDEDRTSTGEAEDMVPIVAIRRFDALEVKEATGARVYSLREALDGHLRAHYLPWSRDTGYYIVPDVNVQPPLFFTAMLSGCGAGFVEAPDRSAVRFSHHNINLPKTRGAPAYTALDNSLAFTQAKLHPRDYREIGNGFGHVHGVMRDKRWQFYAQIITMK
ncbi:MAG: hypothetical protein JWO38_346 [Gemmataceae bacterium]|nr:hypothetical protein [Gemmataceae bacterium]